MNAKNISLWTRMSRLALGVLVVAGSLLPASGQEQFSWKGDAPDGYFKRGADGGRWYKHSNGDSYWDAYDDHGIIFFANDRFPNMTNNAGNPKITHQIYFSNNTARTISGDGFRFYVYGGSSYPKIQNDSSGTHTFNSAITGDGDASDYMELNPVSGNLVFNGAVNNNGSPIRVWGSNTLYINGVHSGGGQLQVKSAATVVLTNANTYSGGTWIEKGKVEINTRSNALGTGAVNVGTNATLDIKHAMNLQPLALTLYNGTVTKTTTGSATWYGGLTTYNSSTVSVSSGNLYFRGGFDIASGSTLVFSNVNAGGMDADTMTGAGTLVKYGGGTFRLRPGTHSGNIELKQGNIWQYTGTMNSGGTLTMDGGTEYSADSTAARTLTKAVVIKGGVALAQNSTGGLEITNTVSLDNGTRIITNKNQVLISGKISSGGLGKAGDGTMILTGDNDYAGGTVISGGTLQIGNNGTAGVVTGAITNNAALVWYRSDSVTNTGVISGTGTLTKQGAGTLTLTGSSTMSGGTTVSAGTLLVSGALGSSAMTVNSGATLAGAGTVGPISSLAGTISPGNSTGTAGTLTVNGAAALGGGTYTCDVTGLGSTDCDKIAASGAVGASSALTINLPASAPGGFNANSSYSWPIMSGSSASAANMTIGTKWAAAGTFGVSASGNTIVITYTAPAPAKPAGLTASDGTSTAHVALSWTDGSGETGYVIWRHTANSFGSATAIYTNAANTTTYNDSSANPGQSYYYWVTATNASGSSAESDPDTGYRRLAAPTGVAATDGTSTSLITVTWDAVTGATGYHVFRDTDSDPAGATALGAKASGFTDAVTPGQIYYYWVVASNSTSSSTSDWSSADSGYVKLTAPGDVAATENQSDKVTVSWSDVTGETGYTIYRHEANNSGAASIIGTAAANATSYNDASATAGTTYYYWVRATNSTSQSMSDFSDPDTGMKTLTEPSKAASNILFSALANTSYTVSWERGDGDYVLVVAHQGSAPTDPTDTTTYNANAAFGSGDTTAAGSYVVYKGTGTNVSVTALSAETVYYFAVYEFNGAATPNYRTHDEPVANRTTLAAEPGTQASNIGISGPAEVSMSGFTWTDGNGAGRILVAKAGSPVDAFPADGTAYTAHTNFGSGNQIGTGNYVVWVGSGQPARISSLERDTVYHFRLFEYNGSAATINYNTNTAAGNPYSQTTMAANPSSAASDLTVTSIGADTLTVTWTKGTAGTNTLIVIRSGADPAAPTDMVTYSANAAFGSGDTTAAGSYVVYTNTGTSVTVTGLSPATQYRIWAYAFNGKDGSQNYRTSDPAKVNATTLMPEPSQATSISFDNLADTSYRVSFTAGDGLSRLVVAKAGSAVSWLPTDGTAYAGPNNNLGLAADLGDGNRLVHAGTSPFTLSGLTAETVYHIRIFEYQGTNVTLNYNTNAASGNPGSRYTLSEEPTAYGTLSATALSDTQIKLEWTAATGADGYVIVRKSGSAPSGAPADGSSYSQGNAIGDGTVVHVATSGAAGSVTDNYSTAAGTTYYYLIFPYAYDGTPAHATYNYRTSGAVPGANATTGPGEPASSSTLTSFLPVSGSSAKIIWDNAGSADGTIILVKADSAVSSNPTDWTNYTASATFGSGSQIGTGNYVVYAAAGKSGDVTVTGLSAGTTYHVAIYPYNGSGAMLNYRSTSPATGSVVLLPDPSAASATVDGKTMVRLAWTKHASYDVMIVYKSGSASSAPTQGAGYSVGSACGGGTVIYKGSGSTLEHVVASGTAHYYAFYSYSGGNYYSAGLAKSGATTAFAASEVVETFSYTNSTGIAGWNGEQGWDGAWYGADAGAFTNVSGSFSEQTNYPAPSGNKLWVNPPDDTGKAVFRPLGQTYKEGRIYFGYILNYQYEGANKYAGLSLCWSNNEEKLFIGEIYGQDKQLGIDNTGSAYTLSNGSGNDYIIVGYYDWSAGEAKAKAYKIGSQAVPTDEPASWDVTVSKASNTVGWVNTIRLAAGAGPSSGTPGNVYFDEVRIATNWAGLIGVVPSKPDDPASASLTVDGHEMLRLAWAKNGASSDVMILHKTSAISTDPTDGTGYSVGNTIDGATVIYKGSATALEHVVAAGSTNYYKFYSYNGANYYSDGLSKDQTMGSYAAHEVVNPFSYTNSTVLGAANKGGRGFGANAWSTGDSGTWTSAVNPASATDVAPRFFNMDNYPPMAGNLVRLTGLSNGESGYADRQLDTPYENGTMYVAFLMSYRYDGANKWAGLSLFDNATEKAFFGKGAGANYHTLAIGDGSSTWWASEDLRGTGANDGRGDTGRVYLVVGKYDFSAKRLQASVWPQLANTFPATEPDTWQVSQDGVNISYINKIRLHAGSGDGGNTIDAAQFDEIRIGSSWAHIVPTVCATWVGSNTLSGVAWTAAASEWLGNKLNFEFQSYPVGLGQVATLDFDWAQNGSFATTNAMSWLKNENNNSYWSNRVQMTAAGVFTSRFTAAGSSCAAKTTNNPALTVQNLNPPTGASATRDGTHTNSQINLEWTRGVSGVAKDTVIVRQTADASWTAPVNGTTYNAGDPLGNGTVVYRGSATTFEDTGLAPDTTYYYRFYSENWSYYSVSYAAANASTAPGGQAITIDGNPSDWLGTPSVIYNNAASSVQQYIWTDKRTEERSDHADHANADIKEFRVFADATWVYFLVRLSDVTDASKPFIAVGVDTRRNESSTALTWLGDDSSTFIGSGYSNDGIAAAHYPEYQLNVHHVDAASGARIEMWAHDSAYWYAPPTGGNTEVVISAANDAIEFRVARADLNLTGTKTARFTVASFINTGAWNNDGDGTTHIADNTANAVDSITIPPWNMEDNDAKMSAWLEDISDGDIDFWFDVKFGDSALVDNQRPTTPVLVAPTNNAGISASPTFQWQAASDNDGQITGYLLEVSTNDQFNGISGTENGTVDLRIHLPATQTNYTFTTIASQYWWRVRARDNAGALSVATTHTFRVVGKLDTEGPQPTLLYIGTNVAGYLAGAYDTHIAKYGPIQSVLDSELRDTNNVFGFVLRWDDPSGVYATNRNRDTGEFAFNIVSTDGRVSPNWDLLESNTVSGATTDWGIDQSFYASNTIAAGNTGQIVTNYVMAAFTITNYDPSIRYYLTVSAEDGCTDGGSWVEYGSWNSFKAEDGGKFFSGWCADGPNTARNITTNYLIEILVTDDDIVPPSASLGLGWKNNDTNAALVISNNVGRLDYVSGEGQNVLYQVTDGALIGRPLAFSFNAYDSYYKGIALGTTATFVDKSRTLTNTSFVAAYWQTNWANYDAARSSVADTRSSNTMLTWYWPSITTQDVTKLWGPDSLSGPLGVTNLIQLDLYDVDNDRVGDQASARVNFGRVVLVDDDATDPTIVAASLQATGTGLAREYALTNLVEWTFDGTGAGRLTSTNVAAGVTSSPISLDTGAIQGTDVITVQAGFAGGGSRSWLFNLTSAETSKTFKAESISFDSRVSSVNGPDTWEVWGKMPGGGEVLWASGTIDLSDDENPVGTNWNSYSAGLAMPYAATNTVEFRIKAYVADTNHLTSTNSTATWSVDNLVVSGYILGPAGGTQITDHDLATGNVSFRLQAADEYSGIDGTIGVTGRAPRVDFWNTSSNVVPITNAFITNGWSADTNTTLTITGKSPAGVDKKKIVLGAGGGQLTYYTRFTVTDADVDRDGDWRSVSSFITNVVYDNDTSRPARGYLFGGPLGLFVDGALTKVVGSGNNREYRINDEQLQTMAATSLTMKVNLYDYSGWTVPVLSVSNSVAGLLSTNSWLTGVHTADVDTTNKPDAAMEWQISQAQATTFFNDYENVTNEIRIVSVWDKDDDRQDASGNNVDALELTNSRLGYMTFVDNDVGLPNVQSNWSVARTNWSIPKMYLGLPGDGARSNLLINGDTVLANTNAGAVLANLTNRVYDSQLAKVTAAAPLSIVLPLFDTGGGGQGRTIKGVQRGTTATESSNNGGAHDITNTSFSVGTVAVSNTANYRGDLSSPLAHTKIAAQFPTSVWAFTSFSYAQVGNWLAAELSATNHGLSVAIYDADDNRPNDQRNRTVAVGTLQVLDNDTVAPSKPADVKVNGQEVAGPLSRDTAAWTNKPEFRVTFTPSVDGDPIGTDLEKTGIGEYRTATQTSDIGPDSGTPMSVPAEGALADYGFELNGTGWTLAGGAAASTNYAVEGARSLRMAIGATATQIISLANTNGLVPRITVIGAAYRGATDGTLSVIGQDANSNNVNGSSFVITNTGVAGQWVIGSKAATTFDTTVDRIKVVLASSSDTYWDDIYLKVELLDNGDPVDEVATIFIATEQGLTTNYLFAVDRDNNRPGDRMASSKSDDAVIPSFGTAYDITPPTPVPMPANAASTETVDDPTTQFDLQWITAGVGPDDEADDNYPHARFSGIDVLSPWRSYKIYYGTFDPLNVPEDDPGHGNGNAYIYTNFIVTRAYTNWPSVTASNTISDPSAAGTNYLALTNLSQGTIRLYDLDYDQDYAVIIVGLDKAGNEGPASVSSWATNNTIRFAVTQGVYRSFATAPSFPGAGGTNTFGVWTGQDKRASVLYWLAAGPTNEYGQYERVNKDYDLIYYDAASFQENSNWTWKLAGTVRTNWFVETNSQYLAHGQMRFFRASYMDRWRRTNIVSGLPQRPLASEEVYAMHNIVLSEGRNFVALHGIPYTNTFAAVFGTDTNIWPAGPSVAAGSTKVEFFSAGTNAIASEVYFFGSDANWYKSGNATPVTTNLQATNFFTRGFSITLPTNLTGRGYATTNALDWDVSKTNPIPAMVWHPILQVPTNGFTHTIHCGQDPRGTNEIRVYNVLALNLPVSVGPAALNLPTNFTRGTANTGDHIYVLESTTKNPRTDAIYCDVSNVWRFVNNNDPVGGSHFKPNDMIVIVSRNGGTNNTWTWTYHPTNFYRLPTRWMGQ